MAFSLGLTKKSEAELADTLVDNYDLAMITEYFIDF